MEEIKMEVLKIVITSLGSLAVLFILTKIMGDREMSQLSMFDYIVSITIGSIAAEMATALEGDLIQPLTAMIVYGLVSFGISYVTCKSIKLRRFVEGHAMILYQNGHIYEKNLLKAKLDVDEFLSMCRICGYFDLEEIYTAILESNGKLSIIPIVNHRPATPADLNLNPTQNYPLANVIIDGKILKDNLKSTGNNEIWLEKQLSSHGVADMSDVFLANYDVSKNKINIYVKLKDELSNDIFK